MAEQKKEKIKVITQVNDEEASYLQSLRLAIDLILCALAVWLVSRLLAT